MTKENPGQLSSKFIVGIRVSAGMADPAQDRMILIRIESGTDDGTISPDIFIDATDPLPPDPPDPPPPGELFFGINTRSGYGGIPLALPEGSLITGTGASDWAINAIGELVPSGTYGAVKSFSLSAGQSYTLTFSDASVRTVTLVAAQAHFTASPTDTASVFQLRTYLQTAGFGGDLVGRDCLINPTRAYWRIRPPAAGYSGAIVIRSENPTAGNDADGNPIRGGGCVIGALAFDPFQLARIPITLQDLTFYNDVDGPHSAFVSYTTTTGTGVGSIRCRYENATNVSFANLNNCFTCRGATAQHNAFVYAKKGVTGGTVDGTYETHVLDNVMKNMTADATQMIGQNLFVKRNFAYNFLDSGVGEHPDGAQHLGTQNQSYTLPIEYEENIWAQNTGAWYQGTFLADTVAPWRMSNVSIQREIFLVGYRGITLTRGDGAVVKNNLCLRMPGHAPSLGNAIFDLDDCINTDSSDNVSNTYVGDSDDGDNNITFTASLAGYQVAMPNFPSNVAAPGFTTRAAVIAACTPSQILLSNGGFKKPDGAWVGPLNSSGAYQS